MRIIEEEVLPDEVDDLSLADEVFVNENVIYLTTKNVIIQYNYDTKTVSKAFNSEYIEKWVNMEQNFFYWRSLKTGYGSTNFQSKINFNLIADLNHMKDLCSKDQAKIFEGTFPHLDKIYFDR